MVERSHGCLHGACVNVGKTLKAIPTPAWIGGVAAILAWLWWKSVNGRVSESMPLDPEKAKIPPGGTMPGFQPIFATPYGLERSASNWFGWVLVVEVENVGSEPWGGSLSASLTGEDGEPSGGEMPLTVDAYSRVIAKLPLFGDLPLTAIGESWTANIFVDGKPNNMGVRLEGAAS